MIATEIEESTKHARIRINPLFWVSLLLIFLVSLPNLIDPMIRNDDYPALLGRADLFWHKTLHEGRWINYLWHLRGIVTPAWLNFAVYQICWAIFATCMTIAASPNARPNMFSVLMVAMILIAPPATLISTWFNTLLLGLALVALYAVIVVTCSERMTRFLLPVFTVLTFMAYTTYPLLLLALCLVRSRNRSFVDLLHLLCLFAVSFIGAVLMTYTLNWYAHGIFGVPLADWRSANPAENLNDLWGNSPALRATFFQFFSKSSMISDTVFIGLTTGLVMATIVMTRRAPMEALYLFAGLLTGVALMTVQSLKLGMEVPARAFIFFWVFYSVILVRGVQLLYAQGSLTARLSLGALIIMIVMQAAQAQKRYALFREWQRQTRQTAAALAPLSGPVYVFGSAMDSTVGRSAHIQSNHALYFRIEQLTGQQLVMCDNAGADCSGLDGALTAAHADTEWFVTHVEGRTVLFIRERSAPKK